MSETGRGPSIHPGPPGRRAGSPRPRWLALPLFALALSIAIGLWSWAEERQVQRELQGVLRSHLESVVLLVREGTRQTADAMDALASLQELHLRSLASLAEHLESAQHPTAPPPVGGPSGLRALLREAADGFELSLGELSEAERVAVFEAIERPAPEGGLLDHALQRVGLACAIVRAAPSRRVICADGGELMRLKRETGLGPLLRELAGGQVVYVAIQDEGGLLVASPLAGSMTPWRDDPELESARQGRATFRELTRGAQSLFEGLSPFLLPDGTTAVLRIGIDARPARSMLDSVARRHRALLAALGLLCALSLGGGLLLRRHAARLAQVNAVILEQERRSAQWHAVGLLAAEVAHEVRNPLSTVRMVAHRLGREFQVSEADRAEYGELVSLLGQESARVEEVVGDFLDLSRPLKIEPRRVALAGLLEEVLAPQRLRAQSEKKRLALEIPPGATARVDPKRFFQILANLVGNALDAVLVGGRVTVAVRENAGGTLVSVADDGPGLSAQSIERLGRAFTTSKAKGTGLGLALSRRLVEAHGGALTLHSKQGEGTVAEVFFPSLPGGVDPEGSPTWPG